MYKSPHACRFKFLKSSYIDTHAYNSYVHDIRTCTCALHVQTHSYGYSSINAITLLTCSNVTSSIIVLTTPWAYQSFACPVLIIIVTLQCSERTVMFTITFPVNVTESS